MCALWYCLHSLTRTADRGALCMRQQRCDSTCAQCAYCIRWVFFFFTFSLLTLGACVRLGICCGNSSCSSSSIIIIASLRCDLWSRSLVPSTPSTGSPCITYRRHHDIRHTTITIEEAAYKRQPVTRRHHHSCRDVRRCRLNHLNMK